MQDLAIKLDLSNFFNDERKLSLLYIDSAWKNISDIEEHIQNLFNLQSQDIHLLTNNDCFLPPKESIKIIKSSKTELIKAFVFGSHIEENQSKKSRKKRKQRSMESELTSSTPYPAKRSKNITEHSSQSTIKDVILETAKAQNSFHNQESIRINSDAYDDNITKLTQEAKNDSISTIVASQISKAALNESNINGTTTFKFSPRKSSGSNIDKELDDKKTTLDTEQGLTKIVEKEIIYRCPLMELDFNKGREFHSPKRISEVKILENICIYKPEQAPTIDNILVNEVLPIEPTVDCEAKQADSPKNMQELPPKCQSDLEKKTDESREEPSIASDSDESVMLLDDDTCDVDDDEDLVNDMLPNTAPMTDLPIVGDTVLFKLLKTKNLRTSGNTNFVAGNCCYVNRRSKAMTFSVISCPPGTQHVLDQYCTNVDDSNVLILNLNFRDLIEPRVIVPTIE